MQVGSIYMPESARDFYNSDSLQMFKVVAVGPGRVTRKGVFIENEIKPGDNVIVDARVGDRPEPFEDGLYLINNPDKVVIGVCPVQ